MIEAASNLQGHQQPTAAVSEGLDPGSQVISGAIRSLFHIFHYIEVVLNPSGRGSLLHKSNALELQFPYMQLGKDEDMKRYEKVG